MLKYLLFSLVTPKCQPTRITSRGSRCVSAPDDASKVTGPVFLKGTEHATMATEEGQGAKHLSNKGMTGLSIRNEHIESQPVSIENQAKMYGNMHAIHQSKKNDVELHEYATANEKGKQANDGMPAPSLTHEYMECLADEPGTFGYANIETTPHNDLTVPSTTDGINYQNLQTDRLESEYTYADPDANTELGQRTYDVADMTGSAGKFKGLPLPDEYTELEVTRGTTDSHYQSLLTGTSEYADVP